MRYEPINCTVNIPLCSDKPWTAWKLKFEESRNQREDKAWTAWKLKFEERVVKTSKDQRESGININVKEPMKFAESIEQSALKKE